MRTLNPLLASVLECFTGQPPAEAPAVVQQCTPPFPPVLLSFAPRAGTRRYLQGLGYRYASSYVVLPSMNSPRWLLQSGNTEQFVSGLRVYEPHRPVGRVLKKGLVAAMRTCWNSVPVARLLIASKDELPLPKLVREVTGEAHPAFALSIGRTAAVRKLTIQVMHGDGRLIGYLKLPLTNLAIQRVRNEANTLLRLSNYASLRDHIARVLYSGTWAGNYLLFQAALDGRRGPLNFGPAHEEFLRSLHEVQRIEVPAAALLTRIEEKWMETAGALDREWQALGAEVLRRSRRDLYSVTSGIMHGDFAPWNTRVRGDRLLIFDWESTDSPMPLSWDHFHFLVSTHYFRGIGKPFRVPVRGPADEASFALYLLNLVCQLHEEETSLALGPVKALLGVTLRQSQAVVSGSSAHA